MAISTIDRELQEHLANFGQEQKQRLLEYARALASRPEAGSGRALLRHAGTISEEGGREMLKAIEEDCEQIDPDGW